MALNKDGIIVFGADPKFAIGEYATVDVQLRFGDYDRNGVVPISILMNLAAECRVVSFVGGPQETLKDPNDPLSALMVKSQHVKLRRRVDSRLLKEFGAWPVFVRIEQRLVSVGTSSVHFFMQFWLSSGSPVPQENAESIRLRRATANCAPLLIAEGTVSLVHTRRGKPSPLTPRVRGSESRLRKVAETDERLAEFLEKGRAALKVKGGEGEIATSAFRGLANSEEAAGVHRRKVILRPSEIDVNQHVTHWAYARLFEDAVAAIVPEVVRGRSFISSLHVEYVRELTPEREWLESPEIWMMEEDSGWGSGVSQMRAFGVEIRSAQMGGGILGEQLQKSDGGNGGILFCRGRVVVVEAYKQPEEADEHVKQIDKKEIGKYPSRL
uniref:Uncharacterized protein n=1 Tax=Chromera velia CCMP2878 TaxID=1169474 RepID=A0A0G4H2A1_9ALVE|eukprot:Cvel_5558.t1-p1 / transcript=Cvel_5558.t1 / gene=Cvel_5558 / organism=Chromera_velia_CCMP2878 / gene_product=hypothetical protein / transcript_product=hypothetical protein / location=Cvel_scaffold261:29313-30936(+) / protein_length=382 / sequence_SO=supercontig / SO=protein_coding / is_pseudo=false